VNTAAVNMGVQICLLYAGTYLWINSQERCSLYIWVLLLVFWRIFILISLEAALVYIPHNSLEGLLFPAFLPALFLFVLLIIVNLIWVGGNMMSFRYVFLFMAKEI
jgi:hypothetical protein